MRSVRAPGYLPNPRRAGRRLALALGLATLLTVSPAWAGGPYGDGDRFSLIFLESSDLPSGFEAQDVSDLSQDTGFKKAGGSHAAKVYWVGSDQTAAIGQLFDLRFVFPDAASAQAYLDANTSELSEGMSSVKKVPKIGDSTRMYSMVGEVDGTFVVMYNVIFRVDNVVVKLFIGQGAKLSQQKLTDAIAGGVAEKAAARIRGSNDTPLPAAAPTPTPTPSPAPSSTPAPRGDIPPSGIYKKGEAPPAQPYGGPSSAPAGSSSSSGYEGSSSSSASDDEPLSLAEQKKKDREDRRREKYEERKERRENGSSYGGSGLGSEIREYWEDGHESDFVMELGGAYNRPLFPDQFTVANVAIEPTLAYDAYVAVNGHPRVNLRVAWHRDDWEVPDDYRIKTRHLDLIYGLDILAMPSWWRVRPVLMGLVGVGVGWTTTDGIADAPTMGDTRKVGVGVLYGGEGGIHFHLTEKFGIGLRGGVTQNRYLFGDDHPAGERTIDGEQGFGRAWRWHAGVVFEIFVDN